MKTKVIMALSECNYEPEITEFDSPDKAQEYVEEKMKDGAFRPLNEEKVEKSMQYVTAEGFVAVIFITRSEEEENAAMTSIEEYMADLEDEMEENDYIDC